MSAYQNTTTAIAEALSETLREVDSWFDSPSDLLFRRPAPERWSIAQILEHITLTNHFLLLVIRKQTARALKKAASGASPPAIDPTDIGRLDRVASYGSFPWVRPEHMEPSSNPDLQSARQRLSEQGQVAQVLLASMPSGEGGPRYRFNVGRLFGSAKPLRVVVVLGAPCEAPPRAASSHERTS